jgi:two-component sensor histidine kinase
VREIVALAVEPYRSQGEDRIQVRGGSPARLPPRMALALAMALQELATNAVKHGALSDLAGGFRCIGICMAPKAVLIACTSDGRRGAARLCRDLDGGASEQG